MIHVLDAGPMVAYLKAEPGAPVVAQTLTDNPGECYAHILNLAEVYYLFFRRGGTSTAEAAIQTLLNAGVIPRPRYKSNAGAVFNLNYHIVFCPKYRRKVLVGNIETRLKELLNEKAVALSVEVAILEVMPDHVYLSITAPPNDAPQHYVNQFKGYTSRVLRQEFPELKRKLPSLWSRAYYIGAVGVVTEDVVRRYIENQKGK